MVMVMAWCKDKTKSRSDTASMLLTKGPAKPRTSASVVGSGRPGALVASEP